MEQACERSNYALAILSMVNQFHIDEKYWDVQLLVDGKLFKCRRLLLAAASEYFDVMFSSKNFKESDATPDQPITLREMDATAFEEILHFMYTGELRVNDSNVLQLLVLNDFLRLRTADVKEKCVRYMQTRSLEPNPMSNAFDLLCFARLKEENVLVDTMNAHICRHLYHFSRDGRFMESSLENFEALLKYYVKNVILPLPGSSDILLVIIHNWINRNREGRSQYRNKLIGSIDSSKVSSKFAVALIQRLEFEVDELRLPDILRSSVEMIIFNMGLDICCIDGNARFNAFNTYNWKNISKLPRGEEVFSPPFIVCNLSWKTCVKRVLDVVHFCLQCNGTDFTPQWNCYARATFVIKSHREGKEDFESGTSLNMFSSKRSENCLSCNDWLGFYDLIDPEKGLIKNDDSITLVAYVFADVPFR